MTPPDPWDELIPQLPPGPCKLCCLVVMILVTVFL
jgi:hypothetical protein